MLNLDLIDVATLARIHSGHRGPDFGDAHLQRILELMMESGVSSEQAQRGLAAICEAALGLKDHYNGKVQHYLRNYGELMLQDLNSIFQFSTLSEDEV